MRQKWTNGTGELKYQLDLLEAYYKSLDLDDGSRDSNIAHNNIKVISLIKNGLVPSCDLLRALLHPEYEQIISTLHISRYFNDDVYKNEYQQNIIDKVMNMKNLLVIKGPPGTGKTTVISEIIKQLVHRNKKTRFLLSSSAHQAVDNVFERIGDLESKDFKMVRIKDVDENEVSKKYSLEKLVESCRNKYNYHIIEKLKNGDLNRLIRYLYGSASLVGVTSNCIVGCNFSYNELFDYAIVDESGKIVTAEMLTAFLFAKKVILIGDPNQLPASYGGFRQNLGISKEELNYLETHPYINYIFDNIHPSSKAFLGKQFRMSNDIGTFVSSEFYKGEGLKNGKDFPIKNALNFLGYDVNADNYCPQKGSRYLGNVEEVELVKSIVRSIDAKKTVAVMAPYKDQVKLLQESIREREGLRIATVDSFQGGECDYVIYSAARNHNVTGFQMLPNRINVAISRAKERFFLVGNKDYLMSIPSWRSFFEFEINGRIAVRNIKNRPS